MTLILVGSEVAVFNSPTREFFKGIVEAIEQNGPNLVLKLREARKADRKKRSWDRHTRPGLKILLRADIQCDEVGQITRIRDGCLGKIYLIPRSHT